MNPAIKRISSRLRESLREEGVELSPEIIGYVIGARVENNEVTQPMSLQFVRWDDDVELSTIGHCVCRRPIYD